ASSKPSRGKRGVSAEGRIVESAGGLILGADLEGSATADRSVLAGECLSLFHEAQELGAIRIARRVGVLDDGNDTRKVPALCMGALAEELRPAHDRGGESKVRGRAREGARQDAARNGELTLLGDHTARLLCPNPNGPERFGFFALERELVQGGDL